MTWAELQNYALQRERIGPWVTVWVTVAVWLVASLADWLSLSCECLLDRGLPIFTTNGVRKKPSRLQRAALGAGEQDWRLDLF